MKRQIVLLMAMLVALAGFGLGGAMAADPKLVVGVDAAPLSMDPHASLSDANFSVMTNIFDGLTARNDEGVIEPALALKYEHPDLYTWKFYLRKGVKFHNGNDFTAQDVKFSFERMKNPECCSEFMDVGKMIDVIDVIDDYTVTMKLFTAVPWFDQQLDTCFIVDKESTETRDSGDVSLHPVGTGAYKFVEWVKGSYLKMTANEDHWRGAPSIKNIELKPITEASTRFAALASGAVDLICGVPIEVYDRLKKNPKLEIMSLPARRVLFFQLANKPGLPTADLRVRQAVYMAINEDEMIEKLMRGQAQAASQLCDPAMVGYNPDIKRLPYDPEKAKALLKEAGYENGFEITLAGPNDRYVQDEKICEAVAKYLAKVGIKCHLDVKPKAVFFPECLDAKHDFFMLGWLANSFDYGSNYHYLLQTYVEETGAGAWNGVRYSNPEVDALFEPTTQIIDPEERNLALQALNKAAMDNVAAIPLHYGLNTYGLQKSKGLNFKPRSDRWMVFRTMSFK